MTSWSSCTRCRCRRLWGVGPKTLEKLQRLGVATIGQLSKLKVDWLVASLGPANGTHLHRLANGIDEREVEPDQKPKSIGHEETFAHDHHSTGSLHRELVRMCDSVASRLRAAGLAGRTVTIKVRFHDFTTITRSVTLGSAIDTGPDVLGAATGLLSKVDPSRGVRLLGVHVSHLLPDVARQLSLDDLDAAGWDDATTAVDAIRTRFGPDAIAPASLTGPDGVRIARRGEQQWGPQTAL